MVAKWYYTYTAECTALDLTTNKLCKTSVPIPRLVSTQGAAMRAVNHTKPPDKKIINVDRIRISRHRIIMPDVVFKTYGSIGKIENDYRTKVLEIE